MNVVAVRLDAPVHFTAFVLRGDEESAERVWVCVRAAESAPAVSWLGCWSREPQPSLDEVKKLLRLLSQSISSGVVIGPYGPALGAIEQFQSWDSWGPGIPRPILGRRPWELQAGHSLNEVSVDDLNLD
ncbi:MULTISPECIES: hypothetical protein [unclassified Streptomyces]|uniref:hypothetical protein n=1 Tax=unclassified Streptomyces TaxID=2593676 RepID=UPI0029AD79B4|nr:MULTISPECIES: hypothetical protein [unclassified Streptomyces]MDX3771537.1 hypothetical protein [Streptomyces sp. AK08-01B]MDX3821383.1 hypothetical protein [Streptomyces sp. AK08-01A]